MSKSISIPQHKRTQRTTEACWNKKELVSPAMGICNQYELLTKYEAETDRIAIKGCLKNVFGNLGIKEREYNYCYKHSKYMSKSYLAPTGHLFRVQWSGEWISRFNSSSYFLYFSWRLLLFTLSLQYFISNLF